MSEEETESDEYERGWEAGYKVGFSHGLAQGLTKVFFGEDSEPAPDEEAPGVGDS